MAAIARRRRSQVGPIVAGGVIAALVVGGLILWALNSDRPPDDGKDVAQQGNRTAPPITDEGLGDATPLVRVDTPPDDVPPPTDPGDTPPDGDDSPTEPADPPDPPEDDPTQDPPETTPPENATEPELQPRQPLPSATAQAAVTGQLDEIYKFAEVKTPAEKLALAGQLLKLAGEARETPAEQFVLLRKAIDLAAAGGDTALMLDAVDAIGAGFEVDALAVKHKFLPQVAKAATDAEKIGPLAEGSLAVVDEALACHRYDVALSVIEAAYRACQRAEGRDYRKRIYDRRKEVQKLHATWQQFQEALATLKITPDDAAANLTVGRWYCFTLGDWQQALPHFSKCSDAALKTAAALELATPSDTPQQVAAGDAWWTAADGAADEAKTALLHRAGHWYEQARPAVKSVLLKGKLDQRLGEIAKVAVLTPHDTDPIRSRPPSNRTLPENLAREAATWASSEFNSRHLSKFAVDGIIAPAGSGEADRDAAWCVAKERSGGRVDFSLEWKQPVGVSEIIYFGRTAWKLDEVWKDYEVYLDDARAPVVRGTFKMIHGPQRITFAKTRLRRITIKFLSSYGGLSPGAAEIMVFSENPSQEELAKLTAQPGGGTANGGFTPHLRDPIKPPPADTGTTGRPSPIGSQPLIPPTSRVTRPRTNKPWDSSTAEFLGALQGHTHWVSRAAFSPDGTAIVSASVDKTVKFWDVATGVSRATLPPFKDQLWSLALAPNGSMLAVSGRYPTITIWDTATGLKRGELLGHTERVVSLAFSPKRSLLASGSWDKSVRVWDINAGRLLWTLEGHTDKVEAVAFSRDGSVLASGSSDKSVRLWNVATGKLRSTLDGHEGPVSCVAFSPEGSLLASGSHDRTVMVRNTTTSKLQQTLRGHTSLVTTLAFGPSGSVLASGSKDTTVKLWDPTSGELQRTLTGHTGEVLCLAFSSDGTTLASGSTDQTLRLWGTDPKKQSSTAPPAKTTEPSKTPTRRKPLVSGRVATGQFLGMIKAHDGRVDFLAFSPDGSTLATGGVDHLVKLWDTAGAQLRRTLTGHTNGVQYLAFSPDGSLLASASFDKSVIVWDVASGEPKTTLGGHVNAAESVAFSPDGSKFASCDLQKVRIWPVPSFKRPRTLKLHEHQIDSIAFSPDGSTLASGGVKMLVKLTDVSTGEIRHTLAGHQGRVRMVAFSPDGTLLASCAVENTVKLWDVATGKLRRTLVGHADSVYCIAFSPDGSTLASGSQDKTVALWDVASGKPLGALTGHTSSVNSIAFSPDGSLLASGSHDKTVRFWGGVKPRGR
ncbi:MAG: WD40 repeat domain-containing protein [Candidatus Nealsonbacteria bacterium]|nr:WD40 repeat domain-containing protein [Candidatus Nealsonbacteria bacterium]